MAGKSKMQGRKPSSQVVKPMKKSRRTTNTTKHHRFQPFAERITKLKIDPIRRRRNVEDQEDLTDEAASYFGRRLEEWRDLNLSATFTAFIKDVAPYSDSLPMVLHNRDTIMDLLATYIQKGDALAMEPILDLLAKFAQDLDVRFEPHFHRAVSTIAAVAAKHQDPAVIEWSFTCLAWLFKYLSRLLVPNLVPLYDLMAPYIGKESQRPFIIRFAAESVGYLVRKAAVLFERDNEPLKRIVSRMVQDCVDSQNQPTSDFHRQGIMTILTEAVKGVQTGLHSSGPATVGCLLTVCGEVTGSGCRAASAIANGTLTSLIHHTDPETFEPILSTLLAHNNEGLSAHHQSLRFLAGIMFTAVSVRKGTRVADWKPVVARLNDLVSRADDLDDLDGATAFQLLRTFAVTIQSATVDAIVPSIALLKAVSQGNWSPFFLRFCDLCNRLSPDRFTQLVLPELQKFFTAHWQRYGDDVCRLLPQIARYDASLQLHVPPAFRHSLLDRVATVSDATSVREEEDLSCVNTLLAAIPYLKLSEADQQRLRPPLEHALRQALNTEVSSSKQDDDFVFGVCFARLLGVHTDGSLASSLWPGLCSVSVKQYASPQFWANLLRYVGMCSLEITAGADLAVLEESLVKALAVPSHEVRQNSLEMIAKLYELQGKAIPDAISTANGIESTPISLTSSRAISMSIRRLAAEYELVASDELVRRAIPIYCFGLLHLRLSQAWDEAISTLVEICKHKDTEEVVIALTRSWLEGTPDDDLVEHPALPLDVASQGFNVVSDFECSNLGKLSAISEQVYEAADSGYPSAKQQLRLDLEKSPTITATSRGQALRLLDKAPQLAEKRSRMLVPVLLQWAGAASAEEADEDAASHRWSRKEQKAMLAVFAKFNNPKVLYKSADVYDALLNLCANGDSEIQSSALKAIFAWKDGVTIRYQEHLVNLLDEARFRDELSVFLQQGDAEGSIKSEDTACLMPILLRLLYGRAIAGGKHGQESRRKAIFIALSRFGQEAVGMFLDVAVAGSAATEAVREAVGREISLPSRRQLGMLNMLNELLDTLGSDLETHAHKILHAVLACTVAASRRLESNQPDVADASLLRSIRQTGIQCLVHLYTDMQDVDMTAEAATIAKEIVEPRLPNFAAENTQSVSGLLRLLAAWSSSPGYVQLLTRPSLLDELAQLLQHPSTKDEVQLFVLGDIIDKLLQSRSESGVLQGEVTTSDTASDNVLIPHISTFVRSIGLVLGSTSTKSVLDACVVSLTKLAGHVIDEDEARTLVRTCSELLKKPSKLVSPRTKTGLLQTALPLLGILKDRSDTGLYEAVSGLYSRLTHSSGRQLLGDVLSELCKSDPSIAESAAICADLNAFGGRLDEPDHDRREHGFAGISEHGISFTSQQWLPILHNCLYFTRDIDDLVNRSSAAQGLAHFIDAAQADLDEFKPLLSQVLMPAIERGMQEKTELVRAEYLRLLGQLVEKLPTWPPLNDMAGLVVGGDEEASFFINALHIQQHRRLRALRRLAEEAEQISSNSITKIFLPFLEHFVLDPAEGDAGRNLADHAVTTIGASAGSLTWPAYRATFKRYAGYISTKEDVEKTVLRLLGALVDALASKPSDTASDVKKSIIITRDFLPPLLEYLHRKDDSTVDRRMPVAVTIVKLLLLLPEAEMSARLPAVLTDVSQVLRSRSQEARDQTRKALANMLLLIGPQYLGFILKELRGALRMGYQLHVLSFTVHSLLVSVTEVCRPGDLNHCLYELTSIIMDDIFGITGQEKDAEEYKSGMKEVKSSKSYDTMELLARVTPIGKLGFLMQPLRALLTEKLDAKAVKKIDDLLNRLRNGVDQNPAADNRDMLVFCHEIVRQVYAEQTAALTAGAIPAYKVRKYLIQMKSANKSASRGSTTSQLFKLSTFALNLVRKVVRKHDELLTPANMAGFLPMIGDALVAGQEEVKLAAMRLLATIIKLPLTELDKNALVYVKEAVAIVKGAPSMTSDSAKAALELITAILRERRSVAVKESDIAHVLKALRADIDEPDRQGVIYKFLRAVLGRKIVITEVYEIMDDIGKVMVVNPDRSVRESARSAYLQFVMDYPQGKDRWNKQAAFLVENLKYQSPAGRQSVMELLHQLLTKLSDDVLAQLARTFFVSLVLVQIDDSDQACRQMAGLLVAKLFERADADQLKSFIGLVNGWLGRDKKSKIQIAALQCWTTYLRSRDVPKKQRDQLRDAMAAFFNSDDVVVGPQLLQALLDTFTVMVEVASDTAFASASAVIWSNVQQCLAASHEEVRECSAKLVGAYFSHLASSSAQAGEGLAALPLRGSGGLALDAVGMRHVTLTSLQAIMGSTGQTNKDAITQTVRNLAFLGRCFAANKMRWSEDKFLIDRDRDVDDGEDDEIEQHGGYSALEYLLHQLSYVIRQENLPVPARSAAVQAQAALVNQLKDLPNLRSLLQPLYLLTDPAISQPITEAHRHLADEARELMELMQKKVGSEAYIVALGEARKGAQAKREERRRKRKIEAVSAPDRFAQAKKRKHDVQKETKKARNAEMRGKRRGW